MEKLHQDSCVQIVLCIFHFRYTHSNSSAADRPEMKQLMELKGKEGRTVNVVEEVAAKWERLACALQFSYAVVSTVRRDNNQNCVAACEKVLYQWVSGADGTRQPVNWATLIKSLRDCEFITLATDLENVLCEH